MSSVSPELLAQLVDRRQAAFDDREALRSKRQAIIARARAESREVMTDRETRDFRDYTAEIERLDSDITRMDEHLAEINEENQRRSDLHNAAQRLYRGSADVSSRDSETIGRAFAANAAHALHKLGGEQRAVVSGSVDVPILIDQPVVNIPFPKRITDTLAARRNIESYAYEYYRQVSRTNNAAPVADNALKPTSVFTVEAISGQAQYIATLTEPAPIRIWWDFDTIVNMLYWNLYNSVLDAIEYQAIQGNGTGVNQTGILNTSGVTVQHYNTDVPTTLRSALSQMQVLGEDVTGWVLHPTDAQNIDLLRWTSSSGGFLSGGFENDSGVRYGTSMNIFGPDSITRLVSPHIPQGVALLGDFRQ